MNVTKDLFCEEEIRCDFRVSIARKRVWAKQIDLYCQIREICSAHNLRCFVIAGTLLGAIRHSGYIPWDDDFDIALPRKDYDVLIRLLEGGALKYPYEIRLPGRRGCFDEVPRLRNSATTAYHSAMCKIDKRQNYGISIDIFPLDEIPDGKMKRFVFRTIGRTIEQFFHAAKDDAEIRAPFFRKTVARMIRFMCRSILCIIKPNRIVGIRERWMRHNNAGGNEEWAAMCLYYTRAGGARFAWKISDFDKGIEKQFEYVNVLVPTKFDNVLKKTYGNWRKFVRGASLHHEFFYDVNKPYKYYFDHQDEIVFGEL